MFFSNDVSLLWRHLFPREFDLRLSRLDAAGLSHCNDAREIVLDYPHLTLVQVHAALVFAIDVVES